MRLLGVDWRANSVYGGSRRLYDKIFLTLDAVMPLIIIAQLRAVSPLLIRHVSYCLFGLRYDPETSKIAICTLIIFATRKTEFLRQLKSLPLLLCIFISFLHELLAQNLVADQGLGQRVTHR